MELKSFDGLGFTALDVLGEIGNIGMGNAATALSQMLGTKVEMSIPQAKLLSLTDSAEYLDKLQETSLGIVLTLSGDLRGMIIHILRKSFAEKIINFFFQSCLNDINDIDEMSMSVISEVGNITSAAYVNAIASMTGLFIDISTPAPCKSLSAVTTDAEKNAGCILGERLLFINTSFFIDEEEVKSDLIFMPEVTSLEMIFEKLDYRFEI